MFEDGYITKREVKRCINYLLCLDIDRDNTYVQKFVNLNFKHKRIGAHPSPIAFDKQEIWKRFFLRYVCFRRILGIRCIANIDYLLYKSWDYYDLDIPKLSRLSGFNCEDYLMMLNER